MTDIHQKVKDIKQSFRLTMDGATAQSMRDKGLDYKLNWGTTLPRLKEMAHDLKAGTDDNYDLAIALWKEDVRECKILATMLMPAEKMPPEVADIWMEQTTHLEIAEQAAFNLYQHLPYAADKAFQWLASENDLTQICGYHTLSRLFRRQMEPNERGINEFIDQAISALKSNNIHLKKAAMASLQHFAGLSLMHQRIAQSATRQAGFNFL